MKSTVTEEAYLFYSGDEGVLKLTAYINLVPNISRTKFEQNWDGGYQNKVKMCIYLHIQSLTTSSPPRYSTPGIIHEIYNSGKGPSIPF
jgi:hypothetical protein